MMLPILTARSALVICVVLCTASAATAAGLCENTPTLYRLAGVSEKEQAVAFIVAQSYCVERGAKEVRGTIDYLELRGFDGRVRARLADAATVRKSRSAKLATPTALKVVTRPLKAQLAAQGFVSGLDSRTCRVHLRHGQASRGGWAESKVSLAVQHGKRTLHSIHLGLAAVARRDEVEVRGYFLKNALVVAGRLPRCDGPAPSGADDGGDCYKRDEPVVRELTAALIPGLARCWR